MFKRIYVVLVLMLVVNSLAFAQSDQDPKKQILQDHINENVNTLVEAFFPLFDYEVFNMCSVSSAYESDIILNAVGVFEKSLSTAITFFDGEEIKNASVVPKEQYDSLKTLSYFFVVYFYSYLKKNDIDYQAPRIHDAIMFALLHIKEVFEKIQSNPDRMKSYTEHIAYLVEFESIFTDTPSILLSRVEDN